MTWDLIQAAINSFLVIKYYEKKELQILADEADAGFIVFTIGSAIQVSSMPENLVKMFAKVFARIPQQVFWKWETSDILMENLSHNVKILKWLPQQDLLGKISCTTVWGCRCRTSKSYFPRTQHHS
jgi:UDP:flavonoid glycosyltransferase YjiC (YdhE family)